MALTQDKYDAWMNNLKEFGLLEPEEVIEDYIKGDYWSFSGQTRGQYLFTNKKVVFFSGFGVKVVPIQYSNIRGIKKCMVSLFIPTGIKVTVFDPEKNKEVSHKLSVMKRANWMNYLSQKSGVPLQ